jgi:luciferase-type oxidoreductase
MLFQDKQLTVGIVLPIQNRSLAKDIDFGLQLEIARRAEALGFSALWVRDVPLNSPDYPDPVGHSDPWVLLGALGSVTTRITLVTGAIVLPLRHPLHVAKAALSAAALTSGRFVLGLGSGDRPSEFAAFGRDRADRREIFRDHWSRLQEALVDGTLESDGVSFQVRPRRSGRIPLVAVGSSSQSLEWIARNADAWMTYHRPLPAQKDRIALWHRAVERSASSFRGLGQSLIVDLVDSESTVLEDINLGYRAGPDGLAAALEALRRAGVHHVAINLIGAEQKAFSDMERIALDVLPRLTEGAGLTAAGPV